MSVFIKYREAVNAEYQETEATAVFPEDEEYIKEKGIEMLIEGMTMYFNEGPIDLQSDQVFVSIDLNGRTCPQVIREGVNIFRSKEHD